MDQTEEKRLRKECCISIEDCTNSRRCFMTGEYCSKQTNIQKVRKKLHENKCINAFVVMDFSNMSDVMYKWRLKSFIESLTKYLYIDEAHENLHCISSSKMTEEQQRKVEHNEWKRVEEIYVVRADSDPASNYVICNRVCQQMQIADLVIVDVSFENTNVFYEFGMAVALGKLILPICYSESFYEMKVPKGAAANQILEQHMACYPWRKKLFEYYGIRYRGKKIMGQEDRDYRNSALKVDDEIDKTHYLDFNEAVNKEYGFTDMQYDRFPYHVEIKSDLNERNTEKDITDGQNKKIGEKIYNRLAETYNSSAYEDNTLVVYTMDGFLNDAQAGECIINFYSNMTKQMKEEHCFGGERVGVLVEGNSVPEDVKDAKTKRALLYSVGEIIHIGMNQATYVAMKEKIKTQDFLQVDASLRDNDKNESDWEKDIKRFVKEYIRNKGFLIYPNNPVYVNRVKTGLQRDILEKNSTSGDEGFCYDKFFCLYHVMLRNLKYTNEIVVDISKNSLQALFWLGAAHGSDIYAITVQHEETSREREIMTGSPEKKERNIFDVAGLWTAIFRSNDTDGFYRQLALAQLGIERHSKLMLSNVEAFEESLRDNLYEPMQAIQREEDNSKDSSSNTKIIKLLAEKQKEEDRVLESYYRDRFWKPMLRYNHLLIYLQQKDDVDSKDGRPRLHAVKWDVDTVAALSNYLSKRKLIGEYRFKTIGKNEGDSNAGAWNFICIGDDARPLIKGEEKKTEKEVEKGTEEERKAEKETESLAEYISVELRAEASNNGTGYNTVHEHRTKTRSCEKYTGKQELTFQGFESLGSSGTDIICAQFPQAGCSQCMKMYEKEEDGRIQAGNKICYGITEDDNCQMNCDIAGKNNIHTQIGQVILWREIPREKDGKVHFWVSMTGVSGPATYGLSAIFVDDDQKKRLFNMEKEVNLLSELQATVREKFMKLFCRKLDEALEKMDMNFGSGNMEAGTNEQEKAKNQRNCYFKRVKQAAAAYLSTVLYRYFLPFLSLEDEYRICNEMRTYVTFMMAAGVSPFSLDYPPNGDPEFSSCASEQSVKKAAKTVPEVLEAVLRGFRGVEAFYEIDVEVKLPSESPENAASAVAPDMPGTLKMRDSRKVLGIKALKKKDVKGKAVPCINCLFKFKENPAN